MQTIAAIYKVISTLKYILLVLKSAVFGAIFGLVVTTFVFCSSHHQTLHLYTVVTGSMVPAIVPGSVAVVRSGDTNKLVKNQIIAFQSPQDPQTIVLHRLTHIAPDHQLVTRGDHNPADDPFLVPPAHVRGVYLFSLPYLGAIISFIYKPLGFFLVVGIPAIIFIIIQIFSLKNAINSEINQQVARRIEHNSWVIIFFVSLLMVCPHTVYSQFSATSKINGLSLVINPPYQDSSTLIPLDIPIQNSMPIILNYSVDGEFTQYVQLCYSYQFQSWRCPNNSDFQSDNGQFEFAPSESDGLYLLASIAHQTSEIAENKPLFIPDNPLDNQYLVLLVDTHAPASAVNINSLSSPTWDDSQEISAYTQSISIPATTSPQLSFSFDYVSSSFAPDSYFEVRLAKPDSIKTIFSFGNNSLNAEFHSGWQNIFVPLDEYSGQNVSLQFILPSSTVQLRDIQLHSSAVKVTQNSPPVLLSSDTGSDVFETNISPSLSVGDNQIIYSAVDVALNSEPTHLTHLYVLP